MSVTPKLRDRLRRGAVGGVAVTLGLLTAGVAPEVGAAGDGLPLGQDNLRETRRTIVLAPGVKLTRIGRGVGRADAAAIQTTQAGPWRLRVLSIDPRSATGHLRATYGADIARTAPTTAMTQAVAAVAGTNGGFFSAGARLATRGNPVGLAVHAGVVESEPTGYLPEAHLLLDAATNTARVTKLRWRGAITHLPSGTSVPLDRVNDAPEVPAGCGLRSEVLRCLQPGEVSVFTAAWGRQTPDGPGVEVVLGPDGCPVDTATTRGTTLRPGQSSVQATGLDVVPVLELAVLGCLDRTETLTDATGRRVPLTPSTFAVNGRYALLQNGVVVAPAGGGSFVTGRHPRTVAGVTADGRLVLLTIDGRSRTSVGATLMEAAAAARSLGMIEAVNLDGGGSTTMAVRGHPSGKPSDGRERAVGDALVYVPAPWRPEP